MTAVKKLASDNLDIWTAAIKRNSAVGRGSSKKIELYGIKKLRALILELAVRGLLVPQDPNDESASELLKKIAAEKAKLLKEGKIKQDKPLPPISERDLQIILPVGWGLTRLGSFASIVRGITFPASEKNIEPGLGLVACLRTANVQAEIDWEDLLYIDSSFIRRDDQYLQVGDIVMSMANSRDLVGKVSYADLIPVERATFGGFLGVIRPYQLSASYLMCVLRAPQTRASLIDSASQTTNIANISLEKLYPLVVTLPPLAEQYRIVAKVDELMVLCDQLEGQSDASQCAHKTLVSTFLNALNTAANPAQFTTAWQRIAKHFDFMFNTEESIDQLKETILQLAVMGKLVPQDPNDEPASELLKKIATEKAKLVIEGKIKKEKPLTQPAENERLFDLPKGWELCRLAHTYDVRDGTHDTPKYFESGIPLVTSKNISSGSLDLKDVRFISEVDHKKISLRSKVDKNDILFAMIGSIGNPVMVETEIEFSVKNVALFKYYSIDNSDPYFLLIFLRYAQNIFRNEASGAVQSFVSLGIIRNFPIALPPLAEQRRIVDKFKELMALCNQLKNGFSEMRITQLNLADAITEQALVG